MAITEIMMTIIKTIRVALLMFMQLIDFLIKVEEVEEMAESVRAIPKTPEEGKRAARRRMPE